MDTGLVVLFVCHSTFRTSYDNIQGLSQYMKHMYSIIYIIYLPSVLQFVHFCFCLLIVLDTVNRTYFIVILRKFLFTYSHIFG